MTDETTPAGEPLLVLSDGDLPEFEGRTPVGVNTNLQGGGQRITRPLHLDDKVVLVVEARVAAVQHPMTKDGMKRTHVLKVEDLYELNSVYGARLMSACKQAWRVSDDHRHGRTALEGLELDPGLELTTDGSGVVLTPGDEEALGLADVGTDPRVAYVLPVEKIGETDPEGGQRVMWPDEFPVGAPVPRPGDALDEPAGVVVLVRDATTGEVLGEWTAADQEARLLAEEQAAEAAEAAEEAVVVKTVEEHNREVGTWARRGRRSQEMSEEQWANRTPWDGYDAQPAKEIVSLLTTKVFVSALARHVSVYEGAHKDRQGVTRAAVARERYLRDREERRGAGETVPADEAELAAGAGDLPPLPDEHEEVDG